MSWIIRKTFTSFHETIGGRDALTKRPEENLWLHMDVSEHIARIAEQWYVEYDLIWIGQYDALGLKDFKFDVNYPNKRDIIPVNPQKWIKLLDLPPRPEIYEVTKKAIQMELGIYSETRTIQELEEELFPPPKRQKLGEPEAESLSGW
ncbi:hypothetical protein FRC02_007642 [Tulasnella sp. 418]|nr:hypothetical protein FRC02_007642 [Tulasnella sp. 418]